VKLALAAHNQLGRHRRRGLRTKASASPDRDPELTAAPAPGAIIADNEQSSTTPTCPAMPKAPPGTLPARRRVRHHRDRRSGDATVIESEPQTTTAWSRGALRASVECAGLDAHDRIGLKFEAGSAAQDLEGDRVRLQAVRGRQGLPRPQKCRNLLSRSDATKSGLARTRSSSRLTTSHDGDNRSLWLASSGAGSDDTASPGLDGLCASLCQI
jgi:hypothetical protein